jgi:very-short-patch-repair endonuclease
MTHFNRTPLKTERARQLRADATIFERKLWAHLRGAQVNGFAFRRQHPVGSYVLDFYCAAAKLAIELDGDQHGTPAGLAYDAARTRFLKQKRIRVMRFGNHELIENLDGVRDEICRALLQTPTLPSPFQGEVIQS